MYFKVIEHPSYPGMAFVTFSGSDREVMDENDRRKLVADLEQFIEKLSFDFEEQE